MSSTTYPTAKDMTEVDETLYSGKYLGVFTDSDWVTLANDKIGSVDFGMDLEIRPVFTYLKYLRSIHMPEGLSTTTSISKTVGQSSTLSVDASITETIEGGIGIIEDSTEFSLSVGFSHTWETSRTTEDSFTITGPASIYFYQPVVVMAYKLGGAWPSGFLSTYPDYADAEIDGDYYMLTAVKQDKTVGLNDNIGLLHFKSVCEYLLSSDGQSEWLSS